MSRKKTPKQPMYQLYEDSPWISRNRELNTQAYDLYSQGLEDLGRQNQDYYEAQASKAMQSAWDDYARNYQKAVNQNLARNYGRTGSVASTSGGYITDSLQRQYNDQAARLASQQAQLQDQFINSALQRDLDRLGQYSNTFNTSGATTEQVDQMNYQTRLKNQDRQWQNDVTRANEKFNLGTFAADTIGGAVSGFMMGGPVGAVVGAAGGALNNAYGSGGANPVTSEMSSALTAKNSGKLDFNTLKQLFGN